MRAFGRFASGRLVVCLGMLAAMGSPALAQQSLSIGTTSISGLASATVDVRLTSTAPTEGFVLAIGYDTTLLSVTGITSLVTAELVAPEVFDSVGGVTLGVVLDATAPFGGQVIPASANLPIARLSVTPDVIVGQGSPPTVVPLTFVDGMLNSPALNNIVVQGGLSLGAGVLGLNNGSVSLVAPPPDSLSIQGATIAPGATGCAQIRLSNQSGAAQGFVLAVAHDADLTLVSIDTAGVTDDAGAEFVASDVDNVNHGGTMGVVLDFSSPFNGQTIAVGTNQLIAEFCYRCDNTPVEPQPATTHALSFVDGVLGVPPLSNVIVVGGLSLNPNLSGGQMTCLPTLASDTMFLCGQMDSEGNIVDPCATLGGNVELCFFYKDPTDNLSGFQLAVVFDCCLEFIEGTFTTDGTILDAVGAEFVNHNVDNDPHDGDGCEFVAGILLDALPPFDRQTVPPTAVPLKIGGIQVHLTSACECNQTYGVAFQDGVNGRGNVPIENLVIVNTTESLQGFATMPCNICVLSEREFIRGDCNFDEKVNIADSATILAAQFQGFQVDCDDACDANDDGKINLADSVYILTYMFKFGPALPAPFPTEGPDATVDDLTGLHPELGCENGIDPCAN
ncbi:MAG: hypothetical protein AB7O52_00590 [Planctomycetota bacterium]